MAQRTCSAPVQVLTRHATWLCLGFAFTTGWADGLCIFTYKVFGTMLTGNTMYCASALGLGRWRDALFYAGAILLYVAGTGVQTWHASRWEKVNVEAVLKGGKEVRMIDTKNIGLHTLLLSCFVAADLLDCYYPGATGSSSWRYHVYPILFALGILNSVTTAYHSTVTNMVTGHWQKIGSLVTAQILKSDCCMGPRGVRAANERESAIERAKTKAEEANQNAYRGITLSVAVIAAFFLGVLLGSVVHSDSPNREPGEFHVQWLGLGLAYIALMHWQEYQMVIAARALSKAVPLQQSSISASKTRHEASAHSDDASQTTPRDYSASDITLATVSSVAFDIAPPTPRESSASPGRKTSIFADNVAARARSSVTALAAARGHGSPALAAARGSPKHTDTAASMSPHMSPILHYIQEEEEATASCNSLSGLVANGQDRAADSTADLTV